MFRIFSFNHIKKNKIADSPTLFAELKIKRQNNTETEDRGAKQKDAYGENVMLATCLSGIIAPKN